MAAQWYDAAVNAVTALLNSGTLKVYSGSQPSEDAAGSGTLLATLSLSSTAFAASSGGTAAANTITPGTAVATGTAGWFELCESGGAVVQTGTVGVSGSGADLILSTTSIVTGASVSCSSYSITG